MKKDGIRITDNQIIGDIGEKYVILKLAKMGFQDVDKNFNDFGEDILCDIFNLDQRTRTNYSVRFQVKSSQKRSKNPQIQKCEEGYYINIENKYLNQWEAMYTPVFIIIYVEEEDKAYWCYPSDQKENFNNKRKAQKIIISKNNILNNTTYTALFERIEKYYESMLKLNNFEYQCEIYPIIMPDYKFITISELIQNNIFCNSINNNDLLPSFLTSYESLSPDETIPFFTFNKKAKSYNDYYSKLINYIKKIKIIMPKDRWLGFVISPIKYIESERNFNLEITDWQSFSLLNNNVVNDYNFTFNLDDNYIETYKTRALSEDASYILTQNSKVAIVIFGSARTTVAEKRRENIRYSFMQKSILPWNIAGLSKEKLCYLKEWLNTNNKYLVKYEESKDIAIISNGNYDVINGAGALMWVPHSMVDDMKDDCSSENFISQIPFGNKLKDDEVRKMGLFSEFQHNLSEELFVEKDNYLNYVLYNHKNRLLEFVLAYDDSKNYGIDNINNMVNKLIKKYKLKCDFDVRAFEDTKLDIVFSLPINSFESTNIELKKYISKIDDINKNLEMYYENITEKLVCFYYMRGKKEK